MEIKKLSELKTEIQNLYKNDSLIPFIGSGFSAGSITSYHRKSVPSGNDMKEYMINKVIETGISDAGDVLKYKPFSYVARHFKKNVDVKEFRIYLQQHCTDVILPIYKKNILDLSWRRIYTLNIDDSIENNSKFNCILLPCREFNEEALTSRRQLIKLHGDANDFITYTNSQTILSIDEYIDSLTTNVNLLSMLKENCEYSNLLFVGCSLDDEIDLLTVTKQLKREDNINTQRYFVTNKVFNNYELLDLENYGVTKIIKVDSYESFYCELYDILTGCKYIEDSELSSFKNFQCKTLPCNKEETLPYLIYGKHLLDKNQNFIMIPHFFVSRVLSDVIIKEMNKYPIQFICGRRVSGKSYLLIDILTKIKDRNVYYFDSRTLLDDNNITKLLKQENSLILIDTNVLSLKALMLLVNSDLDILKSNSTNIICCINKSDQDSLWNIHRSRLKTYDLSSSFTDDENIKLNSALKAVFIPPIIKNTTILDGLFQLQDELRIKDNTVFDNDIILSHTDEKKMTLLIMLATYGKISAQDIIRYGLLDEQAIITKELKKTVEIDYYLPILMKQIYGTSIQIVCNAQVWFLGQMRQIANKQTHYNVIINAYKRLISIILSLSPGKYKEVEQIIKFDIINDIFGNRVKLIRGIYDGIQSPLADSYQYYHQRAKCYMWGLNSNDYDIELLYEAKNSALIAEKVVSTYISNKSQNDFRYIAKAHIQYTLMLIYSKLCYLENFKNNDVIEASINYFDIAVSNYNNYDAFHNIKNGVNKNSTDYVNITSWLSYLTTHDVNITESMRKKIGTIFEVLS